MSVIFIGDPYQQRLFQILRLLYTCFKVNRPGLRLVSHPTELNSPLELAAVCRHGEASNEEDDRYEQVCFAGKTNPFGISQGLLGDPEDVEQTDDGDQGRIFQ